MDLLSTVCHDEGRTILQNVGGEDMRSTDHKAEQERLGGLTRVETEEQNAASTGSKSGATASILTELTMNLKLGLTKTKESMESLRIDVRTEIKQEMREVKEIKKVW